MHIHREHKSIIVFIVQEIKSRFKHKLIPIILRINGYRSNSRGCGYVEKWIRELLKKKDIVRTLSMSPANISAILIEEHTLCDPLGPRINLAFQKTDSSVALLPQNDRI
jgi:hypothetical protein